MKQVLFALFLLLSNTLLAQEEKLLKIIGSDFKSIPAFNEYPKTETDSRVEIIPNLCLYPDTSGLVYNNEFVLFRNNVILPSEIRNSYRFIQTHATTVGEYQEFQNWVRDSIFREELYAITEADKEAAKMIVYDSKSEKGETPEFDISNRGDNRELFPLNWDYPLNPDEKPTTYYLGKYYTPYIERFYKIRAVDERKLIYCFYSIQKRNGQRLIVDEQTATITNPYSWSVLSTSQQDERALIGQTYNTHFLNQPVVGITGMQARAFCFWKEQQIQRELNAKKIPAYVTVTLPAIRDLEQIDHLDSIKIPEKDYTEQWKITVADYTKFVTAVLDSMVLDELYPIVDSDEDAARLIHFDKHFYEMPIEMVEWPGADIANRDENRYIFPLKYDKTILKKYKTQVDSIRLGLKEINYVYFWINASKKGIVGELEIDPRGAIINYPDFWEMQLIPSNDPKVKTYGMNLDLGYTNKFCQNTGVRSHENMAEFIMKEVVNVKPSIPLENQSSEHSVDGITYEQALAFYNWKYPIWKAKSGDNWQDYVFPTKEQFDEHQLSFPVPTFRYVVTFTKQ